MATTLRSASLNAGTSEILLETGVTGGGGVPAADGYRSGRPQGGHGTSHGDAVVAVGLDHAGRQRLPPPPLTTRP